MAITSQPALRRRIAGATLLAISTLLSFWPHMNTRVQVLDWHSYGCIAEPCAMLHFRRIITNTGSFDIASAGLAGIIVGALMLVAFATSAIKARWESRWRPITFMVGCLCLIFAVVLAESGSTGMDIYATTTTSNADTWTRTEYVEIGAPGPLNLGALASVMFTAAFSLGTVLLALATGPRAPGGFTAGAATQLRPFLSAIAFLGLSVAGLVLATVTFQFFGVDHNAPAGSVQPPPPADIRLDLQGGLPAPLTISFFLTLAFLFYWLFMTWESPSRRAYWLQTAMIGLAGFIAIGPTVARLAQPELIASNPDHYVIEGWLYFEPVIPWWLRLPAVLVAAIVFFVATRSPSSEPEALQDAASAPS